MVWFVSRRGLLMPSGVLSSESEGRPPSSSSLCRPSASSRARGGVPKPPKPPPGDHSGRGPRGDQPGDPAGYSAPPGDARRCSARRCSPDWG